MAVEIQTKYNGELQCEALHGPSKDILITDAPVDNHGKGQHFSPTDLLATSLATCMLTTMGIAAAARQWDVTGCQARIQKHMDTTPRRRVGQLVVHVTMPKHLDAAARSLLEKTAETCPVAMSLSPNTEVVLSFEYV